MVYTVVLYTVHLSLVHGCTSILSLNSYSYTYTLVYVVQ